MARKKIPNFATEAEEQEFWQKNDSTGFVDLSSTRIGLFPERKPSTKAISLRLLESLISALKVVANKRDVPYQSLMKVFLAERLQEELREPDNKRVERATRRGRSQ